MNLKINKGDVIVFDLDDTLYNEVDFLKSAYFEISYHLDPTRATLLYMHLFTLYGKQKNVFEYLVGKYPISLEGLLEMYRNHVPKIAVFEGVKEIITRIKSLGGELAIITDGRSITQRNKIEQLGLSKYFKCIIISEEIESEKPNILNYQKVMDFFKSNSYTYIADNLNKDFISPNKLGWNSIALIDNGKNIHKTQDIFFKSLEKLPRGYIKDYFCLNIR